MRAPRLSSVLLLLLAALAAVVGSSARGEEAAARRPIAIDDLARIRAVSSPDVSPDGKWIAYTVSTTDVEKDKRDTDLWMVSWDGREQVRLTSSAGRRDRAALEPGRPLPRLSRLPRHRGREEEGRRRSGCSTGRGGEAQKLTDIKGGVSDYAWSPDGKRLVLVVGRQRPGRRAGEDGRLEAQDGAADRHRPLSLQAGPRRLSQVALLRTSGSSTWRRGRPSRSPTGPCDDSDAGLVARRHADRLRQRARRRIPTAATTPNIFVVEAKAGAEPRPAHDLRRARRRPPVVEPDGRGSPTSRATSRGTPPTDRTSWPSSRRPAVSRAC